MSLRNSPSTDLTVAQIAAHLQTHEWNITRELQRAAAGEPNRLKGHKAVGEGPGAGGPWRIKREDYYARLGISPDDVLDGDLLRYGKPGTARLNDDGLPVLIPFAAAAAQIGIPLDLLRTMVRQNRWTHVTFGRSRFFTVPQLEWLQRLAADENWVGRLAEKAAGSTTMNYRDKTR